jgi:hypothetical protein
MKWKIWREGIVMILLCFLCFLVVNQYVNAELYSYQIINSFDGGHTVTEPLLASEKPFLFWFYKNDWLIFLGLILMAVLLADWKYIYSCYKK